MFNDIKESIVSIVGEGRADDIMDVLYALDEINYHEHDHVVQDAINKFERDNGLEAVDLLTNMSFDILITMLRKYGIIVDKMQDLTIRKLYQVLILLIRIERYPFKEILLEIIERANTPVECLEELLIEFHGDNYEDMIDIFEKVDPELFDRLRKISLEEIRGIEDQVLSNEKIGTAIISVINELKFINEEEVRNEILQNFIYGKYISTDMSMERLLEDTESLIIKIMELSGREDMESVSKIILTTASIKEFVKSKINVVSNDLFDSIYYSLPELVDSLELENMDMSSPTILIKCEKEFYRLRSLVLGD